MEYLPRSEFEALHKRDKRWAVAVTHRRAGKTVACVNHLILAAVECPFPRPQFAYIAPQLNQAKDIAWNYLLDYTAHFGRRRRVSATELWSSFRTGSISGAASASTAPTIPSGSAASISTASSSTSSPTWTRRPGRR